MSDDLTRITDWLGKWMSVGGSLMLMTGYDGTLTAITGAPGDAHLPAAVRADLETLATSPRVRLAVVSGRDVADLRARVALPGAIYVGCHGLEVEGSGVAFRHPDAEYQQSTLRAVALTLDRCARSVEGMQVELKRLGVAVHYRHVASSAYAQVQTLLSRSLMRQTGAFKVFHGAKVIEVLPHVAWNKGHCAQWILERVVGTLTPPVLAVYIGQAWTDAQAFEALARRAVTIGVGAPLAGSRVQYRLADVDEVQGLLSALAAGVRGATDTTPRAPAEGR